ncbi:hypothetical protein MNBD_PLANCTO02-3199 [hydrothermal vent metagenome]|uniref:Uncharacterized protein n=1 Tax=hydrothermal vent metagenome TaxID=652676 RepID=A0A3B1DHG0_9ZZZZ
MKRFWLVCIVVLFVSLSGFSSVTGGESHQQFLEALRTNGYYDYALSYLDLLARKPGVSKKLLEGIDYERASTLLRQAASLTNPDLKQKKLKQAEVYFKRFLREHPGHAFASRAQIEQGKMYLERARVANYKTNSPHIKKDFSKQNKLRQQARANIAQAKTVFEKARIYLERKKKSFGSYISPEKKDLIRERNETGRLLIDVQFNLARSLYEEAHTYPLKSGAIKTRLTSAANAFGKLHLKYRDQAGGLYAHMWQAKCYQEQGKSEDIRKALGIYSELLSHGKSPSGKPMKISPELKKIQDTVRYNRFICLNHSTKKNYQIVVEEASLWLAKNQVPSNVSQGIRWEKAIAEEALGKQSDLTKNERKKFSRDAREDAEIVNQYAGEYKDLSTAMIQRLNVVLGAKNKVAKDFSTALNQAEIAFEKISGLEEKLKQAKVKKTRKILEKNLNNHLQETAKKLQRALSFVDKKTNPQLAYRARALLGNVLYLSGNNYEAAVYAGYVADHARKINNEVALQSGVLASAIWNDLYWDVPKGKSNEFEETMFKKSLERTVAHWIDSEQAANSLIELGRIYERKGDPVQAAKQYNRIPKSSPVYAKGQTLAGIALLYAHENAGQWSESEHPDKKKQMAFFESSAEKHLRTAIPLLEKISNPNKPVSSILAKAKLNLANILQYRLQYKGVILVLVKEPYSLVRAIQVKDENSRPKEGIQSKDFAVSVYEKLLLSYIRTSNIKKASETLNALEKIGGKANASLYVSLGKRLSQNIKQLKKEGNKQELRKVRLSFENFIDTLSANKAGQTYGILIWIAETYNSLGKGAKQESPQVARKYFKKAAASYKEIIDQASSKGETFLDKNRVLHIKLRLVNCWREEGQYQKAFQLGQDIINAKMQNNIDVQIEMARLLQSWGTEKESRQLLMAIYGNLKKKKPGKIWGWKYLAGRLEGALNNISPTSDKAKEYEKKWIDAGYQSARCQFEYAKSIRSKKKRRRQMSIALSGVQTFVSIAGKLEDDDWNKFDKLYQDVQRAKGVSSVLPLKKPKLYKVKIANNSQQKGNSSKKKKKKRKAKVPAPSTNWTLVIAALGTTIVLAGGIIFMMIKSSKKSSIRPVYADDAPDLASIETARKQAAIERENKRKRASAALKKRSSSATATKRRSSQTAKRKPKPKRKEE